MDAKSIEKLINNVSAIKLKGGLFAKASIVIMVVTIGMASIAIATRNLWLSCGTIFLIFLFAFVIMWRLINFANRNPHAAILEGAQLLVHEQIQLAAKGMTEIPQALSNLVEETPIEISAASQIVADQPDEEDNLESEVNNG